jgi:peptide deformylase
MMETMHEAGGIGLAANQVGVLHRMIVVDVSDMDDDPGIPPTVMLNPVVARGEGEWAVEEGCLSIPELRDEVARPERIIVQYRDIDFEPRELTLTGMPGRVVQHEIDHLDGVLFVDHLGAVRRKLLRGRLNKIRRGEVETRYPVVGGPEFEASMGPGER